ncbi:MAG: doubled motif LPXTG anchor domain-containing protein, partial [Lachnospiraceae bacterium]|nr:doubled motif LPXTG anchor domain-containing protein [Lachnospiraceae bacterium]
GGGGSSSGTRSPGTGGGPAGPGVPTVTIDPEAVPLANLPEMGNDDILALIDDEEVPLAALPKTGQAGSAALMLMISSMMLAAFAVVTRKKEEEQ